MSISTAEAFTLIATVSKMNKTTEEHFPQSNLTNLANQFREEVLQAVSDSLNNELDFPVVEKTGIALIKALCAPNLGYSLSRSFLPPMFTRKMMDSVDRKVLLDFIEQRADGKHDPRTWASLYQDAQLNLCCEDNPLQISNDIQRRCAQYFWEILGDSFVRVSPYDENAHLKARKFYHAEPYIVTPEVEAERFLVYTRGPKHSRIFAYMLHPELFPSVKNLEEAMVSINVESPCITVNLPVQQHFYPYKETRKEILEAAGILSGRSFYPAASGFDNEIFGDEASADRTYQVEILWGDGRITKGDYSWEKKVPSSVAVAAMLGGIGGLGFTVQYTPRLKTLVNGTPMTINDMSGLKIRLGDTNDNT